MEKALFSRKLLKNGISHFKEDNFDLNGTPSSRHPIEFDEERLAVFLQKDNR